MIRVRIPLATIIYEKTKINEKRPGLAHIKKRLKALWLSPYVALLSALIPYTAKQLPSFSISWELNNAFNDSIDSSITKLLSGGTQQKRSGLIETEIKWLTLISTEPNSELNRVWSHLWYNLLVVALNKAALFLWKMCPTPKYGETFPLITIFIIFMQDPWSKLTFVAWSTTMITQKQTH